jgi:hypothetical protein
MNNNERPGVYADYEVSGVSYSGAASGTVGVCAAGAGENKVYDITSYAGAVSAFDADANMTELVRILIRNGVATIKAVPINDKANRDAYADAFETLCAIEDVKIVICDSVDADVHKALRNAIESADERARYKIGIVEGAGDVTELTARAKEINSERMVLVAPSAVTENGDGAIAGSLSAALAGAIVSEEDPAVPLNGAELYGIGGVSESFTDGDITLLVRGGVTPVESIGGAVSVVRGITTRTLTNGAEDSTFRELTTTMIIDDVLPTIRTALRSSFSRTKNTERTRGAIRTRVIVELEKKLAAEIIDGYDNVVVAQDSSDPTICDVSFEFMVAHGLNQIKLAAHITV